jgi:hypothetical protein
MRAGHVFYFLICQVVTRLDSDWAQLNHRPGDGDRAEKVPHRSGAGFELFPSSIPFRCRPVPLFLLSTRCHYDRFYRRLRRRLLRPLVLCSEDVLRGSDSLEAVRVSSFLLPPQNWFR